MTTMPFYDYRGSWYRVQVIHWCNENVGRSAHSLSELLHDKDYALRPGKIIFKREGHAILYALRWL
jgi:hypothetical protein